MAENRGRYPPEYREQVVELVRGGRSARSLAPEIRALGTDDPQGCCPCNAPQNRPGGAQTGGQTVRQPPGQGDKLAGRLRRP